jgi:hypothetical protein
MTVESQCVSILNRFYRLLDSGDVSGLCALMNSEFVWMRQGKELRSPADVDEALRQRASNLQVFHLLNSVMIDLIVDDHVRYSGYLIVLRVPVEAGGLGGTAPAGIQALHICQGEMMRTAGGWRVSKMNAGPPHVALNL